MQQTPLPTYKSQKIVEAAPIMDITPEAASDNYVLTLILPDASTVSERVPASWLVARGQSMGVSFSGGVVFGEELLVGGYFVRYEDGYTSWSPAEAFEKGHVPMELQEPQSNAEAGLLPQAANEDLAPNELERRLQTQPAPRVSRQSIEQRIADVQYFLLPETNGPRTTICNIVLDNGYSVRGESSCVDPRNFDPEIGKRLAYDDAFKKLWPLFGFLLAEDRFRGTVDTFEA